MMLSSQHIAPAGDTLDTIALPRLDELENLLKAPTAALSPVVATCIDRAITVPLEQFLSRGKALRSKAVEAGFSLGRGGGGLSPEERRACARVAECVEAIHAGSLIVDDIQDNSAHRRGWPALHHTQGIPLALNSGNLLYFLGMSRIHAAGLSPAAELQCSRRLHEQLLRAHYGQALDLAIRMDEIPQADVYDLCLTSMHLKTGALMALAMTMGAIAADIPPDRVAQLDRFGHLLGTGLQMFDDLNNAARLPGDAKGLEDLRLGRPTWVWAYAARYHDAGAYHAFVASVRKLPDDTALTAWFDRHAFDAQGRRAASSFIESAFGEFEDVLSTGDDDAPVRTMRAIARQFSERPAVPA
jgi:geranylgeranyl pyrophosphate synthase